MAGRVSGGIAATPVQRDPCGHPVGVHQSWGDVVRCREDGGFQTPARREPRRTERITAHGFVQLSAAADPESMEREIVFNAALEIAERLAKAGRIESWACAEGMEYRLDCDLVIAPLRR